MDASRPTTRHLALDVFRGVTIALMIVVNTAGPGATPFAQLVHARWFGFTATDLVFPSFLFAMGCSMAFAWSRPIARGEFAVKVVRRTVLIFLLGVLMYWYPFVARVDGAWTPIPFSQIRIMGVLQRIALCYALAALAIRFLSSRRLVVVSAVTLLGYWLILLYFGDPADPLSKLGNAGTRLDLFLLGPSHLYRKDGGFDPEGLLGTLPAVVNVLAGYLSGGLLVRRDGRAAALRWMGLAGLGLIGSALVWSLAFPIAKKLWTSSFVLLTVGLDCLILAALTAVLDRRPPGAVTRFFEVFGRNPLVIYLFSEVFVVTLRQFQVAPGVDPYRWLGVNVFQAIAPGALGSLLCAIAYTLVCWQVGALMARRGIVVKV